MYVWDMGRSGTWVGLDKGRSGNLVGLGIRLV